MTQEINTAAGSRAITNGLEILAYAIAQLIKIAVSTTIAYMGWLTPLYLLARGVAGPISAIPVAIALNIVWGTLTLAVFIVLRGLVGGAPVIVGGPSRERAITSSGPEIGAFALAYGIVVTVLLVVNAVFLTTIYADLYRSGLAQLALGLGLAISAISATIVFPLFIGLRRAFSGR
jgi:hypothetical protein